MALMALSLFWSFLSVLMIFRDAMYHSGLLFLSTDGGDTPY
jgi:hypothetical protein